MQIRNGLKSIKDEIIKLKESQVNRMVKDNVCKNCRAILKERSDKYITTQAFCICCKSAHGGPLCGCCSAARNVYKEVFEELDQARRHLVNSGVDHELTYKDLEGLENLCTTLWGMSNKEYHKLRAEGKVE